MTDINRKLEGYLRGLSKSRKSRVVSADDANRFLDRMNVEGDRRRYINSVFHPTNDNFEPVGTITSARPEAKGTRIRTWQYVQ